MAKNPQAGDAASAKPKSRSALALPISLLLVTIVAAGAGMGVVWLVKPMAASSASSETRAAGAAGAKRTTQLLELPSIIGQVGAERKSWVRADLSVVVPSDPPLTSGDAALLADDYLAYMQTLSLEDLSTRIGLRVLKEDLEERARIRLRAKSAQVVFRSMVIE